MTRSHVLVVQSHLLCSASYFTTLYFVFMTFRYLGA